MKGNSVGLRVAMLRSCEVALFMHASRLARRGIVSLIVRLRLRIMNEEAYDYGMNDRESQGQNKDNLDVGA